MHLSPLLGLCPTLSIQDPHPLFPFSLLDLWSHGWAGPSLTRRVLWWVEGDQPRSCRERKLLLCFKALGSYPFPCTLCEKGPSPPVQAPVWVPRLAPGQAGGRSGGSRYLGKDMYFLPTTLPETQKHRRRPFPKKTLGPRFRVCGRFLVAAPWRS